MYRRKSFTQSLCMKDEICLKIMVILKEILDGGYATKNNEK